MKKKMKKSWSLILDGKKQPPSMFEEKMEVATFLCTPKGGETGNVILGFTREESYREWAKEEGILENYEKALEAIERVKQQHLTGAQLKELRGFQARKVIADTKRIAEELKAREINFRDIKKRDIKKLEKMTKGYEEFGGPILHSGWLFDYRGYSGRWIYLANGIPYGDLDALNFYNRAESGIVIWPSGCFLWDGSWWRGQRFVFHGWLSTFGRFRNWAGSAYVWP